MKKRKIKKEQYDWQERELTSFVEQGLLQEEHKEKMLEHYVIEERQSWFLRVVLMFGAILLGLGVLSFVASNWSYLSNTIKFSILIGSLAFVWGLAWKTTETYPKTAKSLHYLGILIYGASIFLIGQMFHFGGENYQAMLLWALGSLGIGYLLKDRIILVFVMLLVGSYIIDYSTTVSSFPLWGLLIVLGLSYINYEMGFSRTITIGLNVLILMLTYTTVGLLLEKTQVNFDNWYWLFLAGFVLGFVMLLTPVPKHLETVVNVQANIILGINGFLLTFSDVWGNDTYAILFAVGYLLFVLYLIKQGSLVNILILSGLILRFYVDLSVDFMPKSLIFIIGGLVLLATGYIFEKKRKEGGKTHE